MSRGKDPAALMETLGYRWHDPSLLECALTHSSYANESRAKGKPCPYNERLEFLGDAVLQLYISDCIFERFPDFAEDNLTTMRQNLVCEATLARVARGIGLGDYLCLGHGEEQSGGRRRPSVLADAFEATLAALYLDSGGRKSEAVYPILLRLMKDEISRAAHPHADPKTRLQQLVQQDGAEILSYVTVEESGPAHDRVFVVEALINSNCVGRGTGKSKREAEQNAARHALDYFGYGE